MKKRFSFVAVFLMVILAASFSFAGSEGRITQQDNHFRGTQYFEDIVVGGVAQINGNLVGLGQVGNVFYVDSTGTGRDGGAGTKDKPFATVDYAVGRCTADNGDVIFVMPGYTETMGGAAAIDLDVAGITVIGLGTGELVPTLTYDTATDTMAVGADDVTLVNFRFLASVTDVATAITVEAGACDCKIIGCRFDVDLAGTDEFTNAITIGDASDHPEILYCQFRQGAGGAVSAIYLDHDADYARIIGNEIFGDYSTACIVNDTAACDHVVIQGNLLFNGTIGGNAGLGTEPCIELLATTTGIIADNYCACNLATKAAAIVADDCYLFENYYNEDESSAGTGGIIGTASADDG